MHVFPMMLLNRHVRQLRRLNYGVVDACPVQSAAIPVSPYSKILHSVYIHAVPEWVDCQRMDSIPIERGRLPLRAKDRVMMRAI